MASCGDVTVSEYAVNGYVLWGAHPSYAYGTAIKITGGTLRSCRSEQRFRVAEGGWLLAIYRSGTSPDGLRDQVRQRASHERM